MKVAPCDHGPQASPPPPILPAARAFLIQRPWPLFSKALASVSGTRPIVAVIEADATDRRTLCSLLSLLDVDVHDYDSAESYLASRVDSLGCLISDVTLPGMSGFELLRVLRNAKRLTPVILVGEEADVRTAVIAMQEGATDFIEKPHLDLTILRRVANLIERTRH